MRFASLYLEQAMGVSYTCSQTLLAYHVDMSLASDFRSRVDGGRIQQHVGAFSRRSWPARLVSAAPTNLAMFKSDLSVR